MYIMSNKMSKREIKKSLQRIAELEAQNADLQGGQLSTDQRLANMEEMMNNFSEVLSAMVEEKKELLAEREREREAEQNKFLNRAKNFQRNQVEMWVNDQHPLQVKSAEYINKIQNVYSDKITDIAQKRALNKVKRHEKFSRLSNSIADNVGASLQAANVVKDAAKESVVNLTGPVVEQAKKVPAMTRNKIEQMGKLAKTVAMKTESLITKIGDDYRARTKQNVVEFENHAEAEKRLSVWEKAKDTFKAFKQQKMEKRAEISRTLSDSNQLGM